MMCEHCNLGQIKTHFPLGEKMTLFRDKTAEENESLKLQTLAFCSLMFQVYWFVIMR